jgi:hypothetical protein
MFEFLKIQYELGNISAMMLRSHVPRRLTVEQYEEITGEPYMA